MGREPLWLEQRWVMGRRGSPVEAWTPVWTGRSGAHRDPGENHRAAGHSGGAAAWSRGRGVPVRDLGVWAGESKSAWRAGPCQPQTRRPWPRGSPGLLGRLHGEALQLTELKAPFALPVLPEILKNGSDLQTYIFIQHDWPTSIPTPLCPPGRLGRQQQGPGS